MANQSGNGRNQSMSDEDRSTWRLDEDSLSMRDRERDRDRDDERMYRERYRDDELFMQRERERWDDRSSRGWDREDSRSGGWRGMDRGERPQRGVDELFGRGHEGGGGNEMGHGAPWNRDRQRYRQGYMGQRSGMQNPSYREPGDSGGPQQRYGYRPQQSYGYGPLGMYGGGSGPHRMYGSYNPSDRHLGQRNNMWPQGGGGIGYTGDTRYGDGGEQRNGDGQPGGAEHASSGQRIKGWFQGHRGKGPVGYIRSDERIRENVCDALSDDDRVDASNIEVTVKNGEVTLAGTVEDRLQKRLAQECIENISGVNDVQNLLRVSSPELAQRGMTPNGTDKRGRA